MFSRRCGAFTFVVTLALLVSAPFAHSQALTIVQSTARSAGTATPGFNGDSGSATTINLNNPSYIVVDSIGNQFVSDTGNNCVRKIDLAGNVTTVAGLTVSGQSDTCNSALNPTPTFSQGLYQPTGLAIDSGDRLYIADSMHNCIRSLASGAAGLANLTTVVGTCGTAPTGSVTPVPNGLAVDSSNNLYISLQDSISATAVNQVVRHSTGESPNNVCLVAGAASNNVITTCAGIVNNITLNGPSGLALTISGDLLIADTNNHCIRQVTGLASGAATQITAVGQCLNDGSGNSTTALHNPFGIAISPTQLIYISESTPNNVVSYILGSASVQIVSGLQSGTAGPYDSSQDGKATISTSLNSPRGLAFNSANQLFVVDSRNNIVREQSTNLHFPKTSVGSSSSIQAITFVINQTINVSASTAVDYSIASSTCIGSLSPAPAGTTPNTCQVFVRFTPTRPGQRRSALKLTDSISGTSIYAGMQVIGTGALSLFTSSAPVTIAADLASPADITTDAAGNAYVLETDTNSSTSDIRSIPSAASGAMTTVLSSGSKTFTAIASDAAGNWFAADTIHGTISRFGADGSVDSNFITGLDTPTSLNVDLFNNIYIAQANTSHNVIEVYASGVRRILAGSGSSTAANGVKATAAAFSSPSSVTMDLNGTLYIADLGGHRVYAIDKSGVIHIAAGNGTTSTTLVGQAIGTAIVSPSSLAIDAAGDLYIADQSTGIIYVVYAASTGGNNIVTVLDTSVPSTPNGALNIALDGSSNLFISRAATNSVLKLSFANATLNFGMITVGNSSGVKLQSITNAGTDSLYITDPYSITDSHFAVDASSTTCGTSILSGSVCTLGFTFTPTTNAAYTASATLNSNSYNTPQSISLIGAGKQVASLGVSLAASSEVYGQSFLESFTIAGFNAAVPPTGSISFTFGKINICTLTGAFTATNTCSALSSGLAVGTYAISFNYSGDANYAPYAASIKLTVTPANLTVNIANATRTYGAANPSFSATFSGAQPGDFFASTFSTTATSSSPVAAYSINNVISGAAASNYSITIIPGVLTITKALLPLNVAVSSAARTYGAANPAFDSVIAGALNGDVFSVSYSTSAVPRSPVGSYSIVPSISGAALANYNLTTSNGALTIQPATLILTANNATRSYGTANPAFSGTTLGLVNGDTIAVSYLTTANQNSSIGSYPIVPTASGKSLANYTASVVNGSLTIKANANALIINVHSAARVYAAANPAFAGDVAGITSGDDVVVTFTTNATAASSAGNYPISASISGISAGNYTATIHPGTLSINPVSTLTAITTSMPSAVIGANLTFTANVSANSGTPTGIVSFFDGTVLLGNTNLTANGTATFSTGALGIGSHNISAAFQANTNFTTSGASVAQVITSAPGAFTISANPITPFLKGAGTATYQVTVTPEGAFAGQVALACFGLPANASCNFAAPIVNLSAGNSVTTTMTVATVGMDAKLSRPAVLATGTANLAPVIAAVLPIELTGLGVIFAGMRRRKSLGIQKSRLLFLIIFTLGILALAGCAASKPTFQTYTINITGTSLSFPAPAQTTSVLLSVGSQ